MNQHPSHLRKACAELRAQGLRARDVARRLQTSEGALMAAHAVNQLSPAQAEDSLYSATALDADWVPLLQGLGTVGPVMALTRNEHVVHEKIGVYRNVSAQGPIGMALGPEIDLRLFLQHWHSGFHVIEQQGQLAQHSLQFFNAHGDAVHKVHARPQTDVEALDALAQRHARPGILPAYTAASPERPAERHDKEIDAPGLAQAWADMRDTHEFHGLLKRFGVGRQQALRLVEGVHARRTPVVAVEWLLHQAARTSVPIMVFTGNPGCLQIHTGPVHKVAPQGPWLNVLDDGFNLHLRQDAISESWLVSKPTDDGIVTSIELFDAQGELMTMFFGERKPGQTERSDWRELAWDVSLTHRQATQALVPERTQPQQVRA